MKDHRSDGVEVDTCQGRLEGFSEDGVKKFFGIPFALPPVGDLRWRAPQAPAPWSGVRHAKQFSAAPYQNLPVPNQRRTDAVSEDCLYLNVWTTTTERAAKQPVMVWFFGGGNLHGAGSLAHNDGTALAKLGVTVVAPNYRVGPFGFLNDGAMGTNFAIEDDVAALHWVRDNIEAFGGDPSQVMIFGHSAGAVAVRSLLQCPSAKGLFHRAFIQGAGFEHPANGMGWSSARSRVATDKLFEALGTKDPDALRALPVEQIGAAALPLSGIFPSPGHVHTPLNLVWMPVPDGRVMVDQLAGWNDGVPLLVGCAENEARWSLNPAEPYTVELLENMVKQLAGAKAGEVLAILHEGGGSTFEKLDRLYTTVVWQEPAYASMLRFANQGKEVFYVHFARSGPDAVASNRLASHTAPVQYFFATLSDDGAYDEVDTLISTELMHALVEFAKSGVPKNPTGIEWPRFDPQQPRQALVADIISVTPLVLTPLLLTINSLRPVE
jgi:para-nitrobenzyl esterase